MKEEGRTENRKKGYNARKKRLSSHPSRILDIEEAQEIRREKRREALDSRRKRVKTDTAAALAAERKSFVTGKRLVYCAVVLVILSLVAVSGINVVNLKAEAAAANKNLAAREAQKARLTKELSLVDDPAYIEAQAREKLRMIKSGETLYVFETPEEDNSE
jgi:cell division protein FtsB